MKISVVMFTVCLLVVPTDARYGGGTGEPNDPYQIATAGDLIALGETPRLPRSGKHRLKGGRL